MKILVAEDDPVTRKTLSLILHNFGYEVLSASDGKQAWDILQKEYVRLIISDWEMPEMDGVALCRNVRSTEFPGYVFFILLTSRDTKDDLVEGMSAGADDFMVKPFNKEELYARIRAGERILKLEKDLAERNRALRETNEKLNKAYSVIKKDLREAGKIQSSLLPEPGLVINGVQFDWVFLPSTYVAGDIFNYFKLDETHLGFYLLDVAGHGIPASMLSVTLSKVLSTENNKQCVLKRHLEVPPYYEIRMPSVVIKALNQRFQSDAETMQYFTMIYGVINTLDGHSIITQAGHPPPVYLKKGSKATLLGSGGFPVGMFPDLDYEEESVVLNKGDRLFLYSDGITECTNKKNEQFSVERLIRILEKDPDVPIKELMENMEKSLRTWKGDDAFEDDVTLLALNVLQT